MALPVLKRTNIVRYWPNLRDVYKNADFADDLKNEIILLGYYYERNWLKHIDSNNLFMFNALIRTRSTNPAESYHATLQRL